MEKKETKDFYIPVSISLKQPLLTLDDDLNIGIWSTGGSANLNFSQGYFANWIKGGETSISMLTIIKMEANYSKKDIRWDNNAELKLGFLGLFPENDPDQFWFRKNDDRIDINSKYGQKAYKDFYYTFLGNIQTQFIEGKEYPRPDTFVVVSKFLSPGYVILSFGMDYKPSKDFTLMISPLTNKISVSIDTASIKDHTKFGIPQDKKAKFEIGAYLKSGIKYNIKKNMQIENKFNLFTNYTEKPYQLRKTDIDWEFSYVLKFSHFITTTINTHLIYDYDIKFPVKDADGNDTGETKAKVQFKEYFSIGFLYKF